MKPLATIAKNGERKEAFQTKKDLNLLEFFICSGHLPSYTGTA